MTACGYVPALRARSALCRGAFVHLEIDDDVMRFTLISRGGLAALASAGIMMASRASAQTAPPEDVEIQSAPEGDAGPPNPAPAPPASTAPPAVSTAPAPAPSPAPPPTATAPAAAPAATAAPVPPVPARDAKKEHEKSEPPIEVWAYAQAQYESHEDSEDDQRQSGALLNQDRFVLQRLRTGLFRSWEYTALDIELDANTVRGPSFGVYRAEASVFYGKPAPHALPLVGVTLGAFRVPFGYEAPESARTRWFMERTQMSRALFPTEIDVGARLAGKISVFRYDVALTNGEPLNEKSGFALQDPNANKDVFARFGAEVEPSDAFRVSGGVSFNRGKGYHPATSATVDGLQWQDLNHNGAVDVASGELKGVAGQVATPAQNFERWAVGGDLMLQVDLPIGTSTLYGELVVATNLDRGLFIADPILDHRDLREFGWYVAFVQEIYRYAVVGIRVDYYDPNADLFESRAGNLLPSSQRIRTISPLIGAVLPGRARLLLQRDIIADYLARDSLGVPTDYANNQWTLRLQVEL